jgi:hypothetical protein
MPKSQRGGGLGAGWGFTFPQASTHQINNELVVDKIGNCREAVRPGMVSVTPRGLPGMSGGKRRKNRKGSRKMNRKGSRKMNRKASRKYRQSGGRYGFDAGLASVVGGTPSTSGYSPIRSIQCEASHQRIPDSGAANNLNSHASYLWSGPKPGPGQMGGGPLTGAPIASAFSMQTPSGQVPITWPNHQAGSGSPSDMVPTSRYSVNSEPPIQTAAGTLVSVNTPVNYPQMNPACLKTGGGGKKHKKSRKSKKSRKGSRRH